MKPVKIDQDFIAAVEGMHNILTARIEKWEREIEKHKDNIEFLKREIEYEQPRLDSLNKFLEEVGVDPYRTVVITEEELLAALNK